MDVLNKTGLVTFLQKFHKSLGLLKFLQRLGRWLEILWS